MQLGQKVVCRPITPTRDIAPAGRTRPPEAHTGRIVYIHPRGRFLLAEFAWGLRESFFPYEVLRWEGQR